MGRRLTKSGVVRAALTALLWLLVGMVVSVGVAEGFAVWGGLQTDRRSWAVFDYNPADHGQVTTPIAGNRALAVSLAAAAEARLNDAERRDWTAGLGNCDPFVGVGLNVRDFEIDRSGDPVSPSRSDMTLWRSGWPCHCVSGEVVSQWDLSQSAKLASAQACPPARTYPHWHAAAPAPALVRPNLAAVRKAGPLDARPVLLRPLWSGLLLDSATYGAAAWLFLAFSFTLRRVVRKRRGRCISCGYDLTGITGPCPECGGREGARG